VTLVRDQFCCAPDCDRNARSGSAVGLLCAKHYLRYMKTGALDLVPRQKQSVEFACAECGKTVIQAYGQNATRRSKPKVCSKECLVQRLNRKSRSTAPDRFWSKVDRKSDSECWHWMGHKSPLGYGRFTYQRGKTQQATRIAWFLWHGEFPPANLQVCHSCDNPPCVNPNHLWLGTGKENMEDMARKGRAHPSGLKGEAHPRARLTEADVLAIYNSPESSRSLAQKYGVTQTAVFWIKSGRNWSHLTRPRDAA